MPNNTQMPQYSAETRQAVISRLLDDSAGRNKIAASMIMPLRTQRDYTSVARKTFVVEQLPDGAQPNYDMDPELSAYVIAEDGQSIQEIVDTHRVTFPLFDIATLPKITLAEVQERRFDIIERTQDKAKSAIQLEEDSRSFQVLDAVAVSGFDTLAGQINPDIAVTAPITPSVLADAFGLIEQHDLRVARIYMNARDYTDIRKWGRDILHEEAQETLLNTGLQATLWGAKIITTRQVAAGTVYVVCEPLYFGRMPVRTELTVLSADNAEDRTIGFSIFERLGIGAFNPRGLTRLTITRG